VILHVRGETTFNSATMNGAALGKFGSVAEWSSSAEAGWVFDGAMKAARVRLGRISGPVTVNLYR
jgi:hypothetical protein